jgi:hypothetical protein
MIRVIAAALLGWLDWSDWDFNRVWLAVLCGGAFIVLTYAFWPGVLTIWPGVLLALAAVLLGIWWEVGARNAKDASYGR